MSVGMGGWVGVGMGGWVGVEGSLTSSLYMSYEVNDKKMKKRKPPRFYFRS